MNWDDPAARAALAEQVGIEEYNRLHAQHRKASTIATANGYGIRLVGSRFGQLHMVDGTDKAFDTLPEAQAYAATLTKRMTAAEILDFWRRIELLADGQNEFDHIDATQCILAFEKETGQFVDLAPYHVNGRLFLPGDLAAALADLKPVRKEA